MFIKILGYQWEVVISKEVTAEGNCYGSTHQSLQKIFLEPNMAPQHLDGTLLHELLHAIWWQMGLGKQEWMDPKKEEVIVHALAQGLHTVLTDNPDLLSK